MLSPNHRRAVLPALVSAALLCLGADGGPAPTPSPMPEGYTALEHVPDAGTILGRVLYQGQVPEGRLWDVTDHQDICGARKSGAQVRVLGDGLADTVVAIREIHQGKAPAGEPVLSQQQCELVPRVMAMVAGQRLTLINRDPLPALITGRDPSGNSVFKFLQPVQQSKHKKHITEPGLIRVQGDEDRPWSRAVIYVAEHPYVTVSSEVGAFTLEDVPPGTWVLQAWHETLGVRVQEVTVAPGEDTQITFTFGGPRR